MASTDGPWTLDAACREETISRLTANIASLAFAKGVSVALEDARSAAVTAEKRAHNVAGVESRTTTGSRPQSESLRAYTRKLGTLALEAVQRLVDASAAGGPVATAGNATESSGDGAALLDLTGDREFLTRETAEDALAAMLAKDAALRKIKLSTKSFGTDAAEVAAQGIANIISTLEEADLSDIIAGRPEDEALSALRIMAGALASHPNLRALNLSDNALGEKGIRAFAAGLANKVALESLAFQNVGASIHACEALAELVTDAGSLRTLVLYNNMSDDDGAAAIAGLLGRAPQMESFRMASSRVGAAGGIALAQGLSAGVALRRLDLSDNPMTAEVAPALAAVLLRHPDLVALNLNDTSLTDEGVSAVAQALHTSAGSLQELELALNELTPEGVPDLATALRGMPALRRLNLRENELESAGAVALAPVLASLSALQELDLSGNQIKRAGAVAVAKALAGLPAFERLLLDENEISADGVAQIKGILMAAGKGSVLGSMEDNHEEADDDDDEDFEDEAGTDEHVDSELADALAAKAAIS